MLTFYVINYVSRVSTDEGIFLVSENIMRLADAHLCKVINWKGKKTDHDESLLLLHYKHRIAPLETVHI